MVQVTLPDGSVRAFDAPPTGLALAESIGKGLAKAAVAMRVDGALQDLTRTIDRDATVAIVTRDSPDGLEIIRHDAAHALAEAAKELYPDVQVTIGPAIENGFYYDFARDTPFTPDDLARMEERMREIVDRDEAITREVWDRSQAIEYFKSIGEHYKAQIIQELPADDVITIYRQGNFVDLCRGPHLPSTGRLGKAFKLMRLAGAYWRGDHRNAQLQRVYGTAWADEKGLKAHLTQLEEAEKRDHRRLGREMNLFHQQEEAAGMIFWHPKGWRLYRTLEGWLRGRLDAAGYVEVKTPQLVDRKLWEASGHWEKFRQNMYIAENEDGVKAYAEDPKERVFALKPMNCPCHVQIYNQGLRSYRDLPLRMAEFGACHRFEPGGALHGIMRVRGFVQDDAHIFCTEDQIHAESTAFCRLLLGVYRDLGFAEVLVKLADRPAQRHGSDEVWTKAEQALAAACDASGLPYTINPGEGAFYGPKLEFTLRDTIGREWQCGTLQVDFVLPERLGAWYVGEDGQKHHPVMLHRAILGSFERFIGILIEHYAGHLPLWLAPVQAVVATIVSDADGWAGQVAEALRAAGLRVETDLRNEKIGYKVHQHSEAKVPLLIAVGRRDVAERTVSIRRLGRPDQETLPLEAAVAALAAAAAVPAPGKDTVAAAA
ncbi:MAG: threonine--tRNA ligase [Alphaproteobacteria bacterium]